MSRTSGVIQNASPDATRTPGSVRSLTASDVDVHCQKVLSSLHQDSHKISLGNWVLKVPFVDCSVGTAGRGGGFP